MTSAQRGVGGGRGGLGPQSSLRSLSGPGFSAPSGGSALAASEVDEQNDTYVVRQWTTVDSKLARTTVMEMLSKLGPASPQESDLGDVQIQDRDTVQFEGGSGWVLGSIFTHELTYGGKQRLDRTTIEFE